MRLTAQIESDSPPSGTVTFRRGPDALGTAPVTGAVAALDVTNLPEGPNDLSASYGGDAFTQPSTGSVTHVVRRATTLAAEPVSLLGTLTSLRATFAGTLRSAAGVAAGRMLRFTQGSSSCTATTDTAGRGSCSVTLTAALSLLLGDHYTATFAGDSELAPSSAQASIGL